jgi:HEAT repeat protein
MARQMLPREGVAALPLLLPLLESEQNNVWRAAFIVIRDIENEVSVPGREADRLEAANILLMKLSETSTYAIRHKLLRLMPAIIPEGCSITPITDLLKENDLREFVRATLGEIGTTEARQALLDFLPDTDPTFQVAILEGLTALNTVAPSPEVEALLGSSDPEVRLAAARCFAVWGDPGYSKSLETTLHQFTEAFHTRAMDAWMLYADCLINKGGNWDLGISIYRRVLWDESDPVIRNAALAGLGRYGDETITVDLLRLLEKPLAPEMETGVLEIFKQSQGTNLNKALVGVFAKLPAHLRSSCIHLLIEKKDPEFIPVFSATLEDPSETVRQIAVQGLIKFPAAESIELLSVFFTSHPDEATSAICEELSNLSQSLVQKGEGKVAGKVFAILFTHSEDVALREKALAGIRQNPIPETLDILKDVIPFKDLEQSSDMLLVGGIARAWKNAGKDATATLLYNLIPAKLTSTVAVQQALPYLLDVHSPKDVAKMLGFVTEWNGVGPFAWKVSEGFTVNPVSAPGVDLKATYPIDGKSISWKPIKTESSSGLVDLMGPFGSVSLSTAFLYTEIEVNEEMDAVVRTGSDDGIQVWVNDTSILENNIDRGTAIDQDQAPCKLKAGVNKLVVQITQGAGGWNFCLRVTHPDGTAVNFTQK